MVFWSNDSTYRRSALLPLAGLPLPPPPCRGLAPPAAPDAAPGPELEAPALLAARRALSRSPQVAGSSSRLDSEGAVGAGESRSTVVASALSGLSLSSTLSAWGAGGGGREWMGRGREVGTGRKGFGPPCVESSCAKHPKPTFSLSEASIHPACTNPARTNPGMGAHTAVVL